MRTILLALPLLLACTGRVGYQLATERTATDGAPFADGSPPAGDAAGGDAPAGGDLTSTGDSQPCQAPDVTFPPVNHPVGYGVPVRGSCTGRISVGLVTSGGLSTSPIECVDGQFSGFVYTGINTGGGIPTGPVELEFAQGGCRTVRAVLRTTTACDTVAARTSTWDTGFAGGEGTLENPYVLCTAAQLLAVDELLDASYALRNDIDLAHPDTNGDGTVDTSDVVVDPWPVLAADPDGDAANGYGGPSFSGTLVGHGHAIVDLHIDDTADYQGLFGRIGGSVRDVQLVSVDVASTGSIVGALAGSITGDARALYVTGSVTGGNFTGGVCGELDGGTLLDCVVGTDARGADGTGGLVGRADSAEIRYGTVRGIATGTTNVGGVAGTVASINTVLSDLDVLVAVTATSSNAGGLIGASTAGILRMALVRGTVSAPSNADAVANTQGTMEIGNVFYVDTGVAATVGAPITQQAVRLASTFSSFDAGLWDIVDGSAPRVRASSCVLNNPYETGAGTAADPYRVFTGRQLHCVRLRLGSHFRQMGDIDLGGIVPWVPIGHDRDGDRTAGREVDVFSGEYDGGGFAVNNLDVTRPGIDNIGLFAHAQQGARIHHLTVSGTVTGRARVGMLIGSDHWLGGAPAFESITVTGTVFGEYLTGGLVGASSALIADTIVSVDVTGATDTGGIAGAMGNARGMSLVSYSGSVSGGGQVGGAVGRCYTTEGPLDDVSIQGSITATGSRVGGMTGTNTCRIRRARVQANVSGTKDVGGIIGYDYFDVDDPSSVISSMVIGGIIVGTANVGGLIGTNESAPIERSSVGEQVIVESSGSHVGGLVGLNLTVIADSFSLALVRGTPPTGGLVGDNGGTTGEGSVQRCYAAGSVNDGVYEANVGGLIGNNDGSTSGTGTVTGSYWDVTTSGLGTDESTAESEGGLGKSSTKLHQQATFVGWDFASVWSIAEGVDYPRHPVAVP